MSVCAICKKRPAKRFCPALDTKICAVCCAKDRMMELACPESCIHLMSARDNTSKREGELMGRIRMAKGTIPSRLDDAHVHAVIVIQASIAEIRRSSFTDLQDTEILAALTNTRKNLDTADTGLIYEHTDSSPRVQAVSKHIREQIEALSDEGGIEHGITRSVITDAISLEIERLEAHSAEGGDGQSYLRFISLFVPWEKRERDKAKQLIVL
jgi:hypothetical protein